MAADSYKKVKVLVLGDSGVGKTSLVHLMTHKEVLGNSSWTVGCSVEVKLHDYGRALSQSSTYCIELWDVGGSPTHRKGRGIFYQQTHGIILVHDLTNRKSHSNLSKWLAEFHQSKEGGGKNGGRSLFGDSRSDLFDYDPESFADQEVPILIIGTKLDQASSAKLPGASHMSGAAVINVDCTNPRPFTAGSQQMIELNKFFDKVVQRRYFPSLHMASPQVQGGERHRTASKRTSVNSMNT